MAKKGRQTVIEEVENEPFSEFELSLNRKTTNYFSTDQTFAPVRKTKVDQKERIRKETVEAPETKVKNKQYRTVENVYAPSITVYVPDIMKGYSKAYLKMLLKFFEETFSEE